MKPREYVFSVLYVVSPDLYLKIFSYDIKFIDVNTLFRNLVVKVYVGD